VIILATTRSNEESHPRKSLGFLTNRRRMNGESFALFTHALYLRPTYVLLVAITPAQALLVVVGDPEVLCSALWRTFLNYIISRGGWTGKAHSWNAEDVVHVPGYEIVSRKGDIVHGEEFIGGKSEKIYRTWSSVSGGG
jgi:helicase MOV-10